MSSKDSNRWFRKTRWFFFDDTDEISREIEESIRKQFEDFSKTFSKDLIRERILPDGSRFCEWGPFIDEYDIKVGQEGKPQIKEFSNLKPKTKSSKPRPTDIEHREPLIDIMQTDNEVKIFAEIPGVEKKDINLHVNGNNLIFSINTSERKYNKEIKLPAKVDTENPKTSFKNGVLEITLQKKKNSEGERITL